MTKMPNEGFSMLVRALVAIDNEEDCEKFLDDLMTKKEITDMAQRMFVAKLLSEQVVYSKIVAETGASTATISRVKRCLDYGSGGYAAVLEQLEGEE